MRSSNSTPPVSTSPARPDRSMRWSNGSTTDCAVRDRLRGGLAVWRPWAAMFSLGKPRLLEGDHDADGAAEVAFFPAFSGIPGDIPFAFRLAVAGQAGLFIVEREHQASTASSVH